jgi:hypothetical protein
MTIVDKIEIFRHEGQAEEKVFYDGYPEMVKYYLTKLTAEQRMELFHDYCLSCGSDNPKCQCWNDE